jgi:hypothetical protein
LLRNGLYGAENHCDKPPRYTVFNPLSNSTMSTTKLHPEYPFVKIGTVGELHPDEGPEPMFSPDDWMLQIVDVGDGGEPVESFGYRTEAEAEAAVDALLYNPSKVWLLDYHLRRAFEAGDFDMTVKLAEGRGRAEGLANAHGKLVSLRARVMVALG